MPNCNHCGTQTGAQSFRCNYCEQYHCRDHRLPENHDCPAKGKLGTPTSMNQQADAVLVGGTKQRVRPVRDPDNKPYSVFEPVETVGTSREIEGTKSPDVNPDGSIATGESSENESEDGMNENRSLNGLPFLKYAFYLILVACIGYFAYIYAV